MIALADGLPLLQLEDGQAVAFQREWLLRGLIHAAARAGYQKWWLAEHVTESVMSYLALQFQENVLTIPALSEAVQSVLQVIGYAEVAPHFDPGQPAVRLSLVEIAREAGTGYELLFFQCLGGKLRKLLGSGTTSFEFTGLTPCVKHLRARKSWNRECDSLRSEIVEFVRTQTSVIPARGEITVNVC